MTCSGADERSRTRSLFIRALAPGHLFVRSPFLRPFCDVRKCTPVSPTTPPCIGPSVLQSSSSSVSGRVGLPGRVHPPSVVIVGVVVHCCTSYLGRVSTSLLTKEFSAHRMAGSPTGWMGGQTDITRKGSLFVGQMGASRWGGGWTDGGESSQNAYVCK